MTDENALRRIESSISDMRERMARIETEILNVLTLRAEVRLLQDAETRRQGAIGLFGWLVKNGPGLIGATMIFIAGLLVQRGILK